MSIKTFTEELLGIVENQQDIEAVRLLAKAHIRKAEVENRIFEIELENIDPDSRVAIEKQQMKIAQQNEEYKNLRIEYELLKAGINALEIFLKVYIQRKFLNQLQEV